MSGYFIQKAAICFLDQVEKLAREDDRISEAMTVAEHSDLVILCLGLDESLEEDLVECYIPTAEIRELTLPDGTYVMLNSKSILLYPEKFTGETRSVYLIGEANFKVKPDKKHPFIVKANDYQVTALGTEFNVNAYPENKRTDGYFAGR